MRILFCLTTYDLFKSRFLPLAEALKSAGHEVKVVVHIEEGTEDLDNRFGTYVCDWPGFRLRRILDFNPELIFVWNGRFPHMYAAVVRLKERYNVKIIENGWYPQNTNSYMANDLAQISGIAKVPYEKGVCESARNQALLDNARSAYNTTLPESFTAPTPYIFTPMQLEHDTQIVYTSLMFKTMDSLITYVRFLFPDRKIVVTNHPLAPGIQRHSDAVDLSGRCPSLPLAVRADAVIGINSTVLAESMLFNIPTLALGDHVAEQAIGPLCVGTADDGFDLLFSKEFFEANLRPRYEYRALVLLNNQWDYRNPPGWVIDKINRLDFTPRIPQK